MTGGTDFKSCYEEKNDSHEMCSQLKTFFTKKLKLRNFEIENGFKQWESYCECG